MIKKFLINIISIVSAVFFVFVMFIFLGDIIKPLEHKKEIQTVQKVEIIQPEPKKEPQKQANKELFFRQHTPKKLVKIEISEPKIKLPNITQFKIEVPTIQQAKFDFSNTKLIQPSNFELSANYSNNLELENTDFSGIATNLTPIYRENPKYPRQAKLLRKEGYVKVLLTINEKGAVEKSEILASNPRYMFDNAVKNVISRWKFTPKYVNGVPVKQQAIQVIEFKLDN